MAEPETKKDPEVNPTTSSTDETKDNKDKPGTVTETVGNAASVVKDNVYSMFGGGPKKEKKEEVEDEGADEPSGSSKAKAEKDVCCFDSNPKITPRWNSVRPPNLTLTSFFFCYL